MELYKDESFDQALLIEHLRKLLQINHSSETENKTISLHPLIQQMALLETLPSVTSCKTLLHTMHGICLVHGLDIRRPEEVLSSLVSINERIIVDTPVKYLLLLQDEFPYFEKYGVTDYLPRLVERIEYIMQENQISEPCSKALLLDYKAELFYLKKDYSNAMKRRKKALDMITPMLTDVADIQTVSLASNLHNNLANCYLATKDMTNAVTEMQTAITIRKEYESLGTMENHDVLLQMGNLNLQKNIRRIKNLLRILFRNRFFSNTTIFLNFFLCLYSFLPFLLLNLCFGTNALFRKQFPVSL